MRAFACVAIASLLGCSGPASPGRTVAGSGSEPAADPVEPAPEPQPVEPAEPADAGVRAEPASASPGLLWSDSSLDLDGDGAADGVEVVSSHARLARGGRFDSDPRVPVKIEGCDRRCVVELRVGRHRAEIPLVGSGYFGGFGVTPVDIDSSDGRTELLFTQRGGDSEDPPFLFTIALYDGASLRVEKLFASGGYNSGDVLTDGSGTLTVIYDECPDRFTVVYQLVGGTLQAGPVQTQRTQNPDNCSACPHVYAVHHDDVAYKGELLRDLRGESRRGAQSLLLRNPHRFARTDGVISLQVREQKREVTHLYDLWIEVDGQRIEPVAFRPAVLEFGDRIDVQFRVPPLSADSNVALWADGYYVVTE